MITSAHPVLDVSNAVETLTKLSALIGTIGSKHPRVALLLVEKLTEGESVVDADRVFKGDGSDAVTRLRATLGLAQLLGEAEKVAVELGLPTGVTRG